MTTQLSKNGSRTVCLGDKKSTFLHHLDDTLDRTFHRDVLIDLNHLSSIRMK
jgi:hypothetical protein